MCRITPCTIRNTNKNFAVDFQTLFLQSEKQKAGKKSPLVIEVLDHYCGSSSFGRARPCQGRGGRFEPGLPLRFPTLVGIFFLHRERPGGEIGRHAGLKIPLAAMPVTVQLRSGAQLKGTLRFPFLF